MSTYNDKPHAEALAGSNSLIIGGTSGIGFAVASGALAVGGNVYLSSSSQQNVTNGISRLKGVYPSAKGTVNGSTADLSRPETLESTILALLDEATKVSGGPLDHIVITAGRAPSGGAKLSDITSDSLDNPEQRSLRIKMPMMIAKFVAKYPGKYLNQSSKSSITVTSGILAKKPFPGMSPNFASAGGLSSMILGLAIDLAPIRVNVVLPGAIATEMLEASFSAMYDMFKQKSLVKEIGTPWDCAEAYLFLMRSRFITGQEIIIDGGSLLSS